jgi:hypothetical protein
MIMTAQQSSADQCRNVSGFAPAFLLGLGKSPKLAEPSIQCCVNKHTQTADQFRSKGSFLCQLKIFSSPLQLVQALQPVVTLSESKLLVAARSVLVQLPSQVAALSKVLQSVLVPMCLPASRVPYAAGNLKTAGALRANVPSNLNKCPAQPMLTRGFSVSSRPQRTAHVQ